MDGTHWPEMRRNHAAFRPKERNLISYYSDFYSSSLYFLCRDVAIFFFAAVMRITAVLGAFIATGGT
jgi:hypothetical protein